MRLLNGEPGSFEELSIDPNGFIHGSLIEAPEMVMKSEIPFQIRLYLIGITCRYFFNLSVSMKTIARCTC